MNDHTIRAARPVSSLFRNRPLGTRGRQRRGRNRKSARVSRPSSVIFPAELAARGGITNMRTNAWCGASFHPGAWGEYFGGGLQPKRRRDRLWSEYLRDANQFRWQFSSWCLERVLGDSAVPTESPLLLPRRRRPLGRTKPTSAKKLSGAIRRSRRRGVVPRRTPPSRRGKPTPAHQVREVAFFSALHFFISPAELPTQDDRTSRGPKICTERQFVIVA